MSEDIVLSVAHLSKKFCRELRRMLAYGVHDIVAEFGMGAAPGLRKGEFWALDDVSFELRRGEAIGVVGDNGAGKSTLLKVLHGLLKPDAGEVRVRGWLEAMIELGIGFNPNLTGHENIEIAAALRGLGREQTERLREAVVAFSELGPFMDATLQTYSSGMKARLSYAIAAGLKPDLMLVDEVLAVGDLAFQRKCMAHMRAYLQDGGALVLVSHNVHQIQSICQRGILLESGRVAYSGTAVDTLNRMFDNRLTASPAPLAIHSAGPVTITDLAVEAVDGGAVHSGAPARIVLHYRADEDVDGTWGFTFWTPDQWVCVTGEYRPEVRTIGRGAGKLSCTIPNLPLVGGRYLVRAGIYEGETRQALALYGWHNPSLVNVRPQAGALSNVQMAANQLVTLDVEWT